MSVPQKFMFDNSFDKDQVKIDPLEELRATFEKKLEDTRAKSFEEGREAGKKAALESIENETRQSLEKLLTKEQELTKAYHKNQAEAEARAIEFGITAGCKLARELIKSTPEPLIEEFFKDAMQVLHEEPEITARLHPTVSDHAISKVESWAQQAGYKGQLSFISDETLGPSDVDFTWSNGGIKRSVDDLMNAINSAMTDFLGAKSANTGLTNSNQIERQS